MHCSVRVWTMYSTLSSWHTYLETYGILSDPQYGFRRNWLTSDLLAYAIRIRNEAIEKHGETLGVSLDISKAFDRVWHEILVSKLPSFGLPAGLSAWIADFLSDRSIRVVIDGSSSGQMAIN
ncbi:hypothetical protein PYW07_010164 [Mythimna separata]|uniref:Reverse transcriptase domain-containing protein n=1 Tax=Mythimna separata TaxID=271217 RepID=A0AAD8DQB3_MYTSE|nr:hypothetical protein PYW07_010164 [Mythimna separata]